MQRSTTLGRQRPRPPWGLIVIAGCYLVLAGAFLATRGSAAFFATVIPVGFLSGNIIALGFGVRAARHRGLPGRSRRAWALIAVSSAALILSIVGYAATGQAGNTAVVPSLGDLAHALFPPAMLAGLLTFPTTGRSRREATKNLLDVLTVVGCGFMILWFLVIGPTVAAGGLSALQLATAMGYPLGDLALLLGAVIVLVRGTTADRKPVLFLITALSFLIVGDAYLGYIKSHPHAGGTPTWQLGCWLTAWYLMAFAAALQCHQASRQHLAERQEEPLRRVSSLPYLATGVAYLVLFWAAWLAGLYPWAGLVAGAALVTGAVAARQLVALRENHQLVVTDNLTGLANRRQLHASLARALERSRRLDTPIGVLQIDMNGFKQINDTLGHEAGDAMLVAFAKVLKDSVLGSDTVARLGGDEFAVVMNNCGGSAGAVTVAQRIIDAMAEPVMIAGQPRRPGASIGVAVMEATALPDSNAEAIRKLLYDADLAMYAAKLQKPANAWSLHVPDPEPNLTAFADQGSDLR
ncbi:putative signaling protein [Actinoplanes sp. SE50]|uniref:GGDEF domain-containing protein n=1 Tax=unclassified Actinoplanes TaxID=2626549 RepID=UPI00023ECA0B|nr:MULTISPECIES: GGDEF domain-containing protein [unclassified Actinoplanes]AEV87090.1 putative signaling protein [Actinoplanes sp. SE50/110]ATO85488.1 putative signaling protein [Actinoplanes sp. SE50]SLM02900.1 signaling protein [Actinoplanes sp. SE50/110]